MKKIILMVSLVTNFIYAESCNVQNLRTKDSVEEAQKCMLRQLNELDKYFKDYDDYHITVKVIYKKLIKQEGTCKKWNILYTRTKKEDYKIGIAECDKLYDKRQKEFNSATKQFRKITKQFNRLQDNKEALELKKEMIENAADLLGVRR